MKENSQDPQGGIRLPDTVRNVPDVARKSKAISFEMAFHFI
jgi:hypothetical protein